MKYAILPVLAVAGLVHAAPFSGQGLPATTGGVVHLDLDSAGQSELVKTIREIGEAAAAANAGAGKSDTMEQLKKELGVDDKSIRDMTVAVMPGAKPGAEPGAIFRLRGAFSKAKFEALSKNHKELTPRKSGKHTWYSVADLSKAFGDKDAAAKPGAEKGGVFMPDDSTAIVFSDEKLLADAVSAAEGKSAYKPDTAAKALFAGKPMLAGYFPESFIKAVKPASPPPAPGGKTPSEVKSVIFSLNDAAGSLMLHADTKFDSPAGARETQSQAAMMTGFIGMGLAQGKEGETEAQAQDRAFAASALQALKFAANGDTFTTDFSFPTEKLVAKLTEKRSDILTAIAAQAKAKSGGSAGAAPARRTKKAVVTPPAE